MIETRDCSITAGLQIGDLNFVYDDGAIVGCGIESPESDNENWPAGEGIDNLCDDNVVTKLLHLSMCNFFFLFWNKIRYKGEPLIN